MALVIQLNPEESIVNKAFLWQANCQREHSQLLQHPVGTNQFLAKQT